MKKQLTELSFTAGVCAGVVYDGQPSFMEKYIKEITNEVTFISSFTSKWLNDSLTSSWPSVHNQILKEQIMRNLPEDGSFDEKNSEAVVNHTLPILMITGLPNHNYKILIAKAHEKRYEHYFEGSGNHCSVNKGVLGFDTMIGMMNSSNVQLKNYAKELNATIQTEMRKLAYAPDLLLIAEKLKKKLPLEDCRCWGIVRRWSSTFLNSCPEIDYHGTLDILSYGNNESMLQGCQQFLFYFF